MEKETLNIKQITGIVAAVIIVLVCIFIATRIVEPGSGAALSEGPASPTENEGPLPNATTTPNGYVSDTWRPITATGRVACLPHRDTRGPQTLECAIGLKTDDGSYYAFDASAVPNWPMNTDSRVQVKGMLTPTEALSTNMWQKYNMVGIIKADSIIEI